MNAGEMDATDRSPGVTQSWHQDGLPNGSCHPLAQVDTFLFVSSSHGIFKFPGGRVSSVLVPVSPFSWKMTLYMVPKM